MIIYKLIFLLITTSVLLSTYSCSSTYEESVEDKNIQVVTEIDSFIIQNFIEINGYSIFVGEYNYSVIRDTLDIKVLPNLDAVSYCGRYGYVIGIAGEEKKEDEITVYIKDLDSGKELRSAKLKDIIADSKYGKLLNDIDTIMDPDGSYFKNLGSAGRYFFKYHERWLPNLLTHKHGIVIGTYWWYQVMLRSDYNSGFYLFLNNELELEKFVTLRDMNFSSRFFIDYGDSIFFTRNSNIQGIYHTQYPMSHSLDDYNYGFNLFDFSTLELFNETPNNKLIGRMDSTPLPYLSDNFRGSVNYGIIDRKFFYLNAIDGRTPILVVYNTLAGKVTIFNTPSLNLLLDGNNRFYGQNFCVQGLSEEYIILEECSNSSLEGKSFEADKQNFYAIPRKILDYAN